MTSIAVNDDNPDKTILFTLQKHTEGPNGGHDYSTSVARVEYFIDTGLFGDIFSASDCLPIICLLFDCL